MTTSQINTFSNEVAGQVVDGLINRMVDCILRQAHFSIYYHIRRAYNIVQSEFMKIENAIIFKVSS